MFYGIYALFRRLSRETINTDLGERINQVLAEYHRVRDEDTK